MRFSHIATAFALSAALCAPTFAQSNQQCLKDAQEQTKRDHKADKAQAKADKATHKALKSDKAKDAAKKQDKADQEAIKAAQPQ